MEPPMASRPYQRVILVDAVPAIRRVVQDILTLLAYPQELSHLSMNACRLHDRRLPPCGNYTHPVNSVQLHVGALVRFRCAHGKTTEFLSMSDAVAAMVGEIVRAARLLGCATILVGIQPETAQALIALQDTVTTLRTASDLAAGLRLVH